MRVEILSREGGEDISHASRRTLLNQRYLIREQEEWKHLSQDLSYYSNCYNFKVPALGKSYELSEYDDDITHTIFNELPIINLTLFKIYSVLNILE